ncbi:unnamed protein product, partial [Mesorhabditis belari]|uniref:Cytochrome b-c1 complex subunit 8 n=1 Tax=Mesorhabditis belari TaxID=2138241 RepID=A0AAF3F4Y9_9BILA
MRVTSLVRGGRHFGNLGKMYGEYRMSLSPNNQSVTHGFAKQAFINVFKNYIVRNGPYYLPQVFIGYYIYDWANKSNWDANRKIPADYANDS